MHVYILTEKQAGRPGSHEDGCGKAFVAVIQHAGHDYGKDVSTGEETNTGITFHLSEWSAEGCCGQSVTRPAGYQAFGVRLEAIPR